MQRKAVGYNDYSQTLATKIQGMLDKGWEVEHMVGGTANSALKAVVIFVKDDGSEE